jgi:hypothetical protein
MMTLEKTEYTYEGKKFSAKVLENIARAFINIDSRREITRTDRSDFDFIVIQDEKRYPSTVHVCGKPESMIKFLQENKVTQYSSVKEAKVRPTNEIKLQTSNLGAESKLPEFKTFATVPSLLSAAIKSALSPQCKSGTAGTALYTPRSKNIHDIPGDALKYLCPFNLNGLLGTSGEGRVTAIIDGDTISMVLYLDLYSLSLGREALYERKKQTLAPVLTEAKDAGFFALFRCRLYGMDAAEHNTREGKVATKLMIEKFQSLRGYVYYYIHGLDKYGRALVDLYEDAEHKQYINYYLVDYPKEQLTQLGLKELALPYFGGTKSDQMKNLPTFSVKGMKTVRIDTLGQKGEQSVMEAKEEEKEEPRGRDKPPSQEGEPNELKLD